MAELRTDLEDFAGAARAAASLRGVLDAWSAAGDVEDLFAPRCPTCSAPLGRRPKVVTVAPAVWPTESSVWLRD